MKFLEAHISWGPKSSGAQTIFSSGWENVENYSKASLPTDHLYPIIAHFTPKLLIYPKNCSLGWAKPMVSTCGKFEAKIRQKIEFTSVTSGGSGNEGDAGDEGGIRGDHGGKQEIIINNNYYEKYRNHEQIEIEKTTLENSSDTSDNCAAPNCDATKVLFNLFIETEY